MSMHRRTCPRGVIVGAMSGLGMAFAATTAYGWTEVGDAGDGIGGNYQIVDGSQGAVINEIVGVTSSAAGDFVDAYLISIVDPANFRASTEGAGFDTRLFLFDINGFGLLANDDSPQAAGFGSLLLGQSSDGTGIVLAQGLYILAIAGFELDPVDSNGDEIFDIISPFTEISGPDGPGGANALAAWEDNTALGLAATGAYRILLEGVGPVPAPSSAILFTLAGMTMMRRRR